MLLGQENNNITCVGEGGVGQWETRDEKVKRIVSMLGAGTHYCNVQ